MYLHIMKFIYIQKYIYRNIWYIPSQVEVVAPNRKNDQEHLKDSQNFFAFA